MRTTQILLAVLTATAATSATIQTPESLLFTNLLKRQEPGTPAYNCHDNCGTALTISKQGDPCASTAFQTDYANCLLCSGPGNYDIWKYYGGSLSVAGKTCGLETEPREGKQADVGTAVHPGSSSSATAVESTVVPSSGMAAKTAGSPTPPVSGSTSSGVVPTPTLSSPGTIAPSLSANGTASFTATPPEQTVNAAAGFAVDNAAGVVGAVVVCAVLAM